MQNHQIELNDWESDGEKCGPADAFTVVQWRGENVTASLRVVGGELWFCPENAGREWNFLVGRPISHGELNRDKISLRKKLKTALGFRVSPLPPRKTPVTLRRVVNPFHFLESGEAFLGDNIFWRWNADFPVEFRAQPAKFWCEVADFYRKREDTALALQVFEVPHEARRDWLITTSPRFAPLVEAAIRQSGALQSAAAVFGQSAYEFFFIFENTAFQIPSFYKEQTGYYGIRDFLPITLQQFLQRILKRFPPSHRVPEIVKKSPILRPLLASYRDYVIPVDLTPQTAHEKLEDLLLLQNFLLEEMSEAQAQILLDELQNAS